MKLAEWLTNSGTSQSDLARRIGVTQGRISQIVKGAIIVGAVLYEMLRKRRARH